MKKLNKVNYVVLSSLFMLFSPQYAAAQQPGNLGSILVAFNKIINSLVPIVFGIALLCFFWGLAKYIFSAGSEESKIEGRRIMIGGIIALFIMSSIWGIVAFIGTDLGIDQNIKTMGIPKLGR